jgi:hypothetical protein
MIQTVRMDLVIYLHSFMIDRGKAERFFMEIKDDVPIWLDKNLREWIKCLKCGYIWEDYGSRLYIGCPRCRMNLETLTTLNIKNGE